MQDFPAHILEQLDPSSLLALSIVGLMLFWLYHIVIRFGIFDARRKIDKGEGDGVPVAFIEAMKENTAAKREERAAVEAMGKQVEVLVATLAANNRIMTDAGQDAAESLNILRNIEKSCIHNGEGIKNVAHAVGQLQSTMISLRGK